MSDQTKIEWTDATWNPITGCSVVSPGCTNCYAMRLAGTRLQHHPSRAGLTRDSKAGPVWTGEVRLNAGWLDQPLRWRRPRRIFVCAHGDLFHETVPDDWIDRVFAVMALTPHHVFQVLTKRPERMRDYVSTRAGDFMLHLPDAARKAGATLEDCRAVRELRWPLPNVWLGVSVEDQQRADERIPILLDTPAAVRWVSAEPLLGPVDLSRWLPGCYECAEECGWRSWSSPPDEVCHACGWIGTNAGEFCSRCGKQDFGAVCPRCEANAVQHHPDTPTLDWIVAGGESGPGARPMHPDWARGLRDQCQSAGVPFLFKQWGAWAPQLGAIDLTDDPEISRYTWAEWTDWGGGPPRWEITERPMWCDEMDADHSMIRVGKTAAGRQLDGRTWSEFPT